MKNLGKIAFIGVLVFAALAGVLSCKKQGEVIVIGTGHKYEPFCYYDAEGELAGYDIAVVKEIDKRLPEYTFKFESFDFENVLVSLGTGKVDVGAHEFEENPQRRATYLYGEEGYSDYDSYLVIKGDGPWAGVINSLEDLAGRPDAVIGVALGSNHEAFVKTQNAGRDAEHRLYYQPYTLNEIANAAIANGTYAARLATQFDIDFYNTLTPGLNFVKVGSEPLIVSKAYFLFRKDNPELQKTFDKALREMKADGTLDKIRDDVLGEYYAQFKQDSK